MLLFLALFGCTPEPQSDEPITPDAPIAALGGSHGDATRTIATRRPAASPPPRAARATPPAPPGAAVYTDCGAGPWPVVATRGGEILDEDADVKQLPPPSYSGGGARRQNAAPKPSLGPAPAPRPQPAPAPRPKPAPTPTAPPAALAPVASAPVVAPPPPPPAAEPSGGVGSGGSVGRIASGTGSDGTVAVSGPRAEADAPAMPPGTAKQVEWKKDRIAGNIETEEAEPAKDMADRPSSGWLDYGATVHLSNDDSMSLASAQRVLFQAMSHRRPKLSEIRPHELLNYFSFDTVPVAGDEMFSVLGAADRDGDTLSVALAVQGGVPERQPLDLTLVVDRSGSMAAEGRMEYTRRGLNLLVDQLEEGDRVDLVWFESRVCTTLRDYVVGRDDPALLRHALSSLRPMSATDLDGGLREAYRIQKERPASEVHGRNRRVMLLTDAFLNTGAVDPNVVSEIGSAYEDSGIRLTAIGVGRDFNDEVLDKLTEKGKGAYVYLGSEAVVDRVFGAGFDSLVQTLAHDVRFSLDLPESLAMERFYGEESSTDPTDIQPIHYYAGTSQVFLQDLAIKSGAALTDDPITMRIEWRDARTGEPDSLELRTTVGALLDGDGRNLHKAQALMAWSDWATEWAMGANHCAGAMDTYANRAGKLADDAEIGFLSDLVQGVCGRPVVARVPVAYKVRVDSDIPIAEVALHCGTWTQSEPLRGGDTVARFDASPGACTLTLEGAVAMRTSVEIPKTGGDLRCTVRGGRMSCT